MTNFYIVSAGAAATLVGLLFVAVQIGPRLSSSGDIARRRAMARSTFTIFAILFALSMYLLLPGQPTAVRADVVIAAAVVGGVRAVRTWLPVWADKLQGRIEFRLWQTAWLITLFVLGVRNSWNLLIEGTGPPHPDPPPQGGRDIKGGRTTNDDRASSSARSG